MSDKNQVLRRLNIWIAIAGCLALLIAGFVGYTIWHLFSEHIYDPAGATTRADVTYYTSVPVPPEARDIRVADFEYQQARVTFIRFSASAEICRKYAETVMPNVPLKSLSLDQQENDLMVLHFAASKFPDLRWFDLPYADKFWSFQSGQLVFRKPLYEEISEAPDIVGADADAANEGYSQAGVRVDLSRGVFYFLQLN